MARFSRAKNILRINTAVKTTFVIAWEYSLHISTNQAVISAVPHAFY